MSDILKEHKVVEKSIADSVDRLGYVFPDRIQQFTDLTYTEVANFSFLLARAKQLKDPAYFPFSRTMITKNERGEKVETTVPLTYDFGETIEKLTRYYMESKISMNRLSRKEVVVVTKAYAGQVAEEKRGWLQRIRGMIHV
ncbi:MAG: hypothetical protein ACPLY9_02055 [Nitrososphaerales archaeon]